MIITYNRSVKSLSAHEIENFIMNFKIINVRHRLHGPGFKSKRFHDLETASKTTRFQGVYTEPIQPLNPTVYVTLISFSGLCASSTGARFDQTRVRRLSSPRPNPESSLAFLFDALQEHIDEKVNISRHLCLFLCGMALVE